MSFIIKLCEKFVYFYVIVLSYFLSILTSIFLADLILPSKYEGRLAQVVTHSNFYYLSIIIILLTLFISTFLKESNGFISRRS